MVYNQEEKRGAFHSISFLKLETELYKFFTKRIPDLTENCFPVKAR